MIVARGGGSLEDLWGFNDEALARAVAASDIPVISAVGHETDWTLIDLVADVRAPTPTGAAEIAVPVKADLEATLASLGARLRGCVSRGFDRKRQAARAAARALPSPDQLLALPRRRFDEATSRLGRGAGRRRRAQAGTPCRPEACRRQRCRGASTRRAGPSRRDFARAGRAFSILTVERRARIGRFGDQLPKTALAALRRHRQELGVAQARLGIEPVARRWRIAGERLGDLDRRRLQGLAVRLERSRARLTQADRLLSTLSHKAALARGFVLVRDAGGEVIKRAADVASGAALSLEFADGTADAVAVGGAAARPKPVAKPREPGNQGSLF